MSTNQSTTPKYSIDQSQDKYSSRYGRLLNILFYAKELPSDLHKFMNMSYGNYRNAIFDLRRQGWVRTVKKDGARGYQLTASGRKRICWAEYMKYADCFDDEEDRHNSMKRRNRKRQYAYLYALFDRVGIPYENFNKPPFTDETARGNQVYFYTALDIKRIMGITSTPFKGSRLLGFLVGKGQIITVYRTNYDIENFASFESLVPDLSYHYFSTPISAAIVICNGSFGEYKVTERIIENPRNDAEGGMNTAGYRRFYVFQSGDRFFSNFHGLYTDYSAEEKRVAEFHHIDTAPTYRDGRSRLIVGTGFTEDNRPALVCPGNINIEVLRRFISNAKYHEQEHGRQSLILCQQRDIYYMKNVCRDRPIIIDVI